jgi:hypothetical protein
MIDAIKDRRDVVVVAQSFGGYTAPIVADRIDYPPMRWRMASTKGAKGMA